MDKGDYIGEKPRTYTLTRQHKFRPKKEKEFTGLRRISVGRFDQDFTWDVHVYRGVCEEIALRAEASGEFSIRLEGIKKTASK